MTRGQATSPRSGPLRGTLFGALAGLFVLIAGMVQVDWQPVVELDHRVGTDLRVSPLSADWVREFWIWVGQLTGTVAMTGYTVVIVLALLVCGRRRLALWVAATMLTVGVGNALVKLIFARHRPVWEDPVQVLTSYSFPSGHSSGIAAFAGVLTVLTLALAGERRWAVRGMVLLGAALVLVVGLDRLALGVHHLSDVVAGWLLGAVVVMGWLAAMPPDRHGILSA